jgi:RHS repeat-associated protein
MTQEPAGNNQPAYQYDALGRRIRKKTGPDSSPVYLYYFYDAFGNVIMEKDGSSARLADHLYFAGERIGLYKPNLSTPTTYFLHKDHLGSTRLVTSYAGSATPGSVLDANDHRPFGDNASGGTTTSLQFTGLERDAATNESGLDHTWFRKYSPNIGRWCSADPLGGFVGDPQSLNRYSYVLNNPMNLVDPLGLAPTCRWVCRREQVGYDRLKEQPVYEEICTFQCERDEAVRPGSGGAGGSRVGPPTVTEQAVCAGATVPLAAASESGHAIMFGGGASGTFGALAGISGTFTVQAAAFPNGSVGVVVSASGNPGLGVWGAGGVGGYAASISSAYSPADMEGSFGSVAGGAGSVQVGYSLSSTSETWTLIFGGAGFGARGRGRLGTGDPIGIGAAKAVPGTGLKSFGLPISINQASALEGGGTIVLGQINCRGVAIATFIDLVLGFLGIP